ncbi:inorganic diphosphatase [Methanolobus sp. ZRKC3]|uniref:inorganic diphosphatase n=1 Tax=Methanolobus sp. ZRKC3 TaxID=3125786 RepID=UPI003253F728
MRTVIETPKYSFAKYHKEGSQFKKEFISPVPAIFNYGFVEGSLSADGMESDVIVIGPRMDQGTIIEREYFDGMIRFIDDSLEDDKRIVYVSGFFSKSLYSLYFHIYSVFKFFYYLVKKRRFALCRFKGIEIHEK